MPSWEGHQRGRIVNCKMNTITQLSRLRNANNWLWRGAPSDWRKPKGWSSPLRRSRWTTSNALGVSRMPFACTISSSGIIYDSTCRPPCLDHLHDVQPLGMGAFAAVYSTNILHPLAGGSGRMWVNESLGSSFVLKEVHKDMLREINTS